MFGFGFRDLTCLGCFVAVVVSDVCASVRLAAAIAVIPVWQVGRGVRARLCSPGVIIRFDVSH